MIGRDPVVADKIAKDFRAIAGFETLPPNWQKLFDDILASAVDDRVPGALLPAPIGGGCRVYAIADDQKEWRRLQPLLSAYAGPTLSSFTGVIQPPSGDSSVDNFVRSLTAEVVAVFEAQDTTLGALRALRRMVAALRQAPDGTSQAPRPTSWLLSDFQDALNVGDRTTAERIITRMREECRLDALNLRFLTVQMLASLQEWSELRAHSFFEDLCLVRKPGLITAQLAETLYNTDLADAVEVEDEDRLQRAYEKIRPIASPLVQTPPPAALTSGGWKLYATAALATESPDPRLLQTLSEGPDLGWLSTKLIPPPSLEQPEHTPPLDAEADLAQIKLALEKLSELPPATRASLLKISPLGSLVLGVGEEAPALVPLGWRDWLTRISDPEYTQAFEVARKGKDEWDLERSCDPVEAKALADALSDSIENDVSRERVAQALPLIVHWLQRDASFPRASLRPVYETVLTLFVLGEARDRGIMASAGIVAEALLAIGSSASDYQRLLDSISTLVMEGVGTANIYVLLDLIEATLRHACPDSAARDAFWLSALAVIEPLRSRLKPVHLASLSALGDALGWQEPPLSENATTGADEFSDKLDGMRIGIYTLTESAARQAASILARVAPGVTVQTSSEHVGSAQLKALAENTDLLVITSLSATHAATDYLRAHRPAGKPLCWAAGRGFTSILRAIEDYVGGVTTT